MLYLSMILATNMTYLGMLYQGQIKESDWERSHHLWPTGSAWGHFIVIFKYLKLIKKATLLR